MHQGDSYYLPIIITMNGSDLDFDLISQIEFAVGDLLKSYPDEVTYNAATKTFLFPLSQSETFAMPAGKVGVQTRVKHQAGDVIASREVAISLHESISKVVL